jgi:hypothetical protein
MWKVENVSSEGATDSNDMKKNSYLDRSTCTHENNSEIHTFVTVHITAGNVGRVNGTMKPGYTARDRFRACSHVPQLFLDRRQ